MDGISISAWRGTVYLSLAELLSVMNEHISNVKWRIRVHEIAPNPRTSAIEALRWDQRLETKELLDLFSHDVQIIDGTIEGFDSSDRVVISLRAVDSTWWDIETEDSRIFKAVIDKFPDAVKVPQ